MGRAREQQILCSPCRTHDLIRVVEPIDLVAETPTPPWVGSALRRAPWVVIRRGPIHGGKVPVGVRGAVRNQRFGAFLPATRIAERLAPEDLLLHATESHQDDRLDPKKAIELLAGLTNAAAPARIDVVLETPSGGASLADIAAMRSQLLVRTPHGPRLILDAWMADLTVSSEVTS
jgi:hypothetical protein